MEADVYGHITTECKHCEGEIEVDLEIGSHTYGFDCPHCDKAVSVSITLYARVGG